MQLYKRFKSYFTGQVDEDDLSQPESASEEAKPSSARRGGPHKKSVAVYRQPVLQNAGFGATGGVQGLDWYKANLKVDSDGDIATEFLQEKRGLQTDNLSYRPLKEQRRNVKNAALNSAELLVEKGQVVVLPDFKRRRQ